jgi:hypothetical protein
VKAATTDIIFTSGTVAAQILGTVAVAAIFNSSSHTVFRTVISGSQYVTLPNYAHVYSIPQVFI